jgi:hypothetical protein
MHNDPLNSLKTGSIQIGAYIVGLMDSCNPATGVGCLWDLSWDRGTGDPSLHSSSQRLIQDIRCLSPLHSITQKHPVAKTKKNEKGKRNSMVRFLFFFFWRGARENGDMEGATLQTLMITDILRYDRNAKKDTQSFFFLSRSLMIQTCMQDTENQFYYVRCFFLGVDERVEISKNGRHRRCPG